MDDIYFSLVIRQKGKSQNGCFKKTKHSSFPKKEHFLPLDTHVRNSFVFQKTWHALFSWNTRFEIHAFALLRAFYSYDFEYMITMSNEIVL